LHQKGLERHDRIKRHHRQVTTQWLKLMNVLREGMQTNERRVSDGYSR
jgi:hypothetical protein